MTEKEYRRAMVTRQIRLVKLMVMQKKPVDFINREKALVAFMYRLYRKV